MDTSKSVLLATQLTSMQQWPPWYPITPHTSWSALFSWSNAECEAGLGHLTMNQSAAGPGSLHVMTASPLLASAQHNTRQYITSHRTQLGGALTLDMTPVLVWRPLTPFMTAQVCGRHSKHNWTLWLGSLPGQPAQVKLEIGTQLQATLLILWIFISLQWLATTGESGVTCWDRYKWLSSRILGCPVFTLLQFELR